MASRLDDLLESIDPSQIIDRVSASVDTAFNTYRYDTPIRTFKDYEDAMSKFVQHVEQIVLGFRSNDPYDRDFFLTRYDTIVREIHGPEAWKWNYEKITTGKEGGLYKLLADVAAGIMQDRSRGQISTRVWNFWNSLSNDEKLATVDEFVRKRGRELPDKFTATNGAYLKANFPRVLEQYPYLLLELRRAVR